MAFLELRDVAKRFGRDVVLEGADLEVARGERVAIFGPSGCGKTVLLRLIAGIHEPDSGDIVLDGTRLNGLAPEQRDVGMAFQNFALYPHMTAFENIASPLRARGRTAAETERRVGEVAELLKIDHVLGHLPRALSNGQKQRTSLARSLAAGPSLLLLDDPLRNVDAKLRYEMRLELPRVLREVNATVLYVTQDYREAMALGQRVAVLGQRRFAQIDPPANIYRRPVDVDVARLFGDPSINLIETEVKDGQVVLFGSTFHAPAGLSGPCKVGIRPEHIGVDMGAGETGFPAELDAVTPLNVRAVLLLKTADGRELLATCPEEAAARFPRGHREVRARLRQQDLLFFDGATGGLRPQSGP